MGRGEARISDEASHIAAERLQPTEAIVRVVVTAGREAARTVEPTEGARPIDAHSYRVVATALATGQQPTELEPALDAFALDPQGVRRFEAMVQRAQQSLVRSEPADGGGSSEVVPVEIMLALTTIHAAFLRALQRRRDASDLAYERYAAAATAVADANDYDELCERAAQAVRELSGMRVGAIYVPGTEYARYTRAALDIDESLEGARPPGALRVDRGLFADVIAGERPVFIAGREPIEEVTLGEGHAHTVLAVPLRDSINRPVGLAIAIDSEARAFELDAVEGMRRLGAVLEGALSAADDTRRHHAALTTLPELARVARRDELEIGGQLDALAEIVCRATDSDAAVVRVSDPAGRYLETRAVSSTTGQSVSDVIGTRTLVGDADETELPRLGEHELIDDLGEDDDLPWSSAGRSILSLLGARAVLTLPIPSLYDRSGTLYVVRRTARVFDGADRACARIVASHTQHVIDRHVSELQTTRAINAARSAIRLLGEGLVAGVRTERTIRFVPRLFHEMFDAQGCRVWRRDRDGTLSLLASAGQIENADPAPSVRDALAAPQQLFLATERRPHIAAVGIDEYHGTRIAIEFQLSPERSLGQEEQRLATDVAQRVGEALWSAEQGIAHERQLERVRALQNVIAAAHEQLSEPHVIATVAESVPAHFGADASAVFVVAADGKLEAASASDAFPARLVEAIEGARHWVPDATGDERASILSIRALGDDPRLASLRTCIVETGLAAHSALVIPLIGREQTVGALVMTFAGGLPEGIDQEGNMLPAFGEHVGAALLNARELERERQARLRVQRVLEVERENSRQVRALHEVSRTFATSLSLDETMRAVVEAMADRLDVDAVWIRTPDDRGDKMLLRAFYASHPELSGALERMVAAPIARDDAITQRVMTARESVLLGGRDDEQQWESSEVIKRLAPFLQRGSTLAVLPVAIPHEVLGTLTMLSIDPENRLTRDKVDVAMGVTTQAALALDNARLYQQQKHFAEVIQESLLPGRLPDIPGIDLGVLYRSATAGGAEAPLIGGDFYDFLELEDGRLALAVGDVTGKGVGAAADTAMTKYIFRALAREHPSPASFLAYANEVVCEEITPGKFVTLFYAVIDPHRNVIVCGNAGHPEPKLVAGLEPGETQPHITSIGLEGIALGIMAGQDYEQREYPFVPGSSLVVYTDGVVEARNDAKLYGQYRLEKRLSEEAGASAPQIAFAVYQDCAAYAEDGIADDVAIVVAQRLEPSAQ